MSPPVCAGTAAPQDWISCRCSSSQSADAPCGQSSADSRASLSAGQQRACGPLKLSAVLFLLNVMQNNVLLCNDVFRFDFTELGCYYIILYPHYKILLR